MVTAAPEGSCSGSLEDIETRIAELNVELENARSSKDDAEHELDDARIAVTKAQEDHTSCLVPLHDGGIYRCR